MHILRNTAVTGMLLASIMLVAPLDAWPQDDDVQIQGKWRMDLRIRQLPGLTLNQRELTIIVTDKMPDGSYRVLARYTTHAVSDQEIPISRPECRGKTECTFDGGSEGSGRLVGNRFYVDWHDESWIDDVFTIKGNRMTGDDGNGPMDFTRIE